MKKKILAILITCILLFSSLLVAVNAEASEKVILDNSVFYIEIPDNYIYSNDVSQNFYIIDSDFGGQTMEFFVEGNLMFPEGVKNAEDDEIISKVRRIIQWSTDISINEVKRKVINGQNAAILIGVENFMGEYDVEYYVFTTKEAVCVISVSYSTLDEKKEIEGILETFTMNGTYFEGDSPVKKHDFSKSPDYYEVVNAKAQEYYEYSESFDDGMTGVMGFIVIGLLIFPATIIGFILLIYAWRKNKKIVKEYEEYFGPIYAIRNAIRVQQLQQQGGNTNNPQSNSPNGAPYIIPQQPYPFVNPQPVNDPTYKPDFQPNPQPIFQVPVTQENVTTEDSAPVTSGEGEDNTQQ